MSPRNNCQQMKNIVPTPISYAKIAEAFAKIPSGTNPAGIVRTIICTYKINYETVFIETLAFCISNKNFGIATKIIECQCPEDFGILTGFKYEEHGGKFYIIKLEHSDIVQGATARVIAKVVEFSGKQKVDGFFAGLFGKKKPVEKRRIVMDLGGLYF